MSELPPGLVTDTHQPTLIDTAAAVFDEFRIYRYALTRRWDEDLPVVAWLMLNPSTADAFKLDATIRRCVAFTRSWGNAGGVLVLNLFALRSRDPAALARYQDPVGEHNDAVIDHYLLDGPARPETVVAAWGTHGSLHNRGRVVAQRLVDRGVQLRCLANTLTGHPGDPLYIPANASLVDFQPERLGVMA